MMKVLLATKNITTDYNLFLIVFSALTPILTAIDFGLAEYHFLK